MNYQDFVVFNPRVKEVATDILCIEFWKPEFCKIITQTADQLDRYQSSPNDPVPGQELRVNEISNDLYISYCKHWKQIIQPILNDYFMLPAEQWFTGWKVPFIIKYEMDKQRSLRPHMDGSMVTGTIRLSNEYTGGDLVFSMLVWPSSIQHLHYSDTLLSGTKYSWISWTKNDRKESGINYDEI